MSDTSHNPPPSDEPPNQPPSYPPPSYPPPPQGGYQPGYSPQSGGVGQPADLTTRFLARLIDYALLIVVDLVLTALIGSLWVTADNGLFPIGMGDNYAAGLVTTVVSAAIYLGYFSLMESINGQTLGKIMLKIQTQGPDGGHPTFEQAVRRNLFTAISVLGIIPVVGGAVAFLGWLAAVIMIAVTINNNTATRQGWHDQFAGGTRVVRIG